MADEGGEKKKSGLLVQILIPVAVALLAGGTAPWWMKKDTPQPQQQSQPQPGPVNPAPNDQKAKPVTDHSSDSTDPTTADFPDFFLGRWHVDQTIGGYSGSVTTDYMKDGRFDGEQTSFNGSFGQKSHISGYWSTQKLGPKTFVLELRFDNGQQWTGKFKILDANHLQNISENYVAERVE